MCLLINVFPLASSESDVFWLVAVASIGGFFLGLSASLSSTYRHWPSLRHYIDAQRVRDDFKKYEA
jgi:hypothetical protein